MHHEFFHLAKNISQNRLTGKNALATIVHVQGSAYRREGTRMVIESSGNWFGNISGGCLEGDILRKAKQVIETGENMLVTYDTRESENKEIRVALGCNGIIDILIELVTDPLVELCKAVVNLFENEKPAFLTTHIQFVKGKINVIRNLSETQPFDFPESAFENENLCLVEKSEFNMTLHEYIGLQRKLVIWGAGPDVMPLARFSSQLGWKTVVIADELNILKTLDVENVEVIQSYPDSFLEHVSLHHNTAVILVSHDYYKDYFVLEKIVQKEVKYIGIMGPHRRGAKMTDEIKISNPDFKIDENKIFYPVGLDIGSENPVEIALSIVSEVQSIFSQKNAAPLKDKTTRIHHTNSNELIEEFSPNDNVCTIKTFQ